MIAMSPNEGNLDSIQSYDSEILTAGAMQKTINPQGQGEFYEQILRFRNRHPARYSELFEECGWSVDGGEISYKGLTKSALKKEIRKDFTSTSAPGKKESAILAPVLNTIRCSEYIELQVMDFIKRLRLATSITPSGHAYQIKQYVRSNLGLALVLDHHINRPGFVARDFGAALQRFFNANPNTPTNPQNWGVNHQSYEDRILEDYGATRQMTDATGRYQALRSRL
ncbi:hypothetical protein ACFPU0_25135 [Pseudomonas sp. GCM10022186]|uniref:hypothetical protein n=1 Tax=Pseudomonas sp. GCM10022186 TaxID=3252650 RepID=UPI00360C79E2